MDMCIFFLVAMPPRICRSDLLTSKTLLASFASSTSICGKRSATSLCTVDLLTPKLFAACLTVALFSTMYVPISTARFSIYGFKKIPCNTCFYIVCKGFFLYSTHFVTVEKLYSPHSQANVLPSGRMTSATQFDGMEILKFTFSICSKPGTRNLAICRIIFHRNRIYL